MPFPRFGTRPIPLPKNSGVDEEGQDQASHGRAEARKAPEPTEIGNPPIDDGANSAGQPAMQPEPESHAERDLGAPEQAGTEEELAGTDVTGGTVTIEEAKEQALLTAVSPESPLEETASLLDDAELQQPATVSSEGDQPPEPDDAVPLQAAFVPICGRPNRPIMLPHSATSRSSDQKPLATCTTDKVGNHDHESASTEHASSEVDEWPILSLIHRAWGSVVVAAVLGLAGLVGLYIYSQVLAVVATLATLPQWTAVPALILLGLLVSAVVLAFGRLTLAYARLRRNRQVRMKDLESLTQRAHLRQIAQARRKEARKVLEDYVMTYPIPTRITSRRPEAPGLTPSEPVRTGALVELLTSQQLDDLRKAHGRLMNPVYYEDINKWLDEYERAFQSVLDGAAESRVTRCAAWVGCKTTISPSPLVDMLIASYWAFVLLRDLCVIYNVRVGVLGTVALLGRVFFNVYVAGSLEGLEEHVEETLRTAIGGFLHGLGQAIVAKCAAKTAIGLTNSILIMRLGNRAIRALQPLSRRN